MKTHHIPSFTATNKVSIICPPHVEYSTPLHELKVTINGVHKELALLDDGSEIVVIHEDIWKASQAKINSNVKMHMQTANSGIQHMPGCLEMLEIVVDGLKAWAHAFIIPDAPYCLLLGCPWQRLVCYAETWSWHVLTQRVCLFVLYKVVPCILPTVSAWDFVLGLIVP